MSDERQSEPSLEVTHSNFFVLRTPLLPVSELTAWSEALTAVQAWEGEADVGALETAWKQDVQTLRSRLRKLIDRPEILHALYVASPALQTGIEHWKRDPDSKKGLQAERALVRYFARMATRSTPFGLFSGCSVGRLQQEDVPGTLVLKPRSQYQLFCRLDFDYLFALTAALQRDPALEMELRYRPNSSLHRIADAWHYTESRLVESKRTHHLVKVESDPYLEAVLSRAQAGATVSELVEAVLSQPGDANPSEEEAMEYVLGLIRDNDFLVSNLSPLLTGVPPLQDIIQQMEALPSGANIAHSLRGVRDRLTWLERKGIDCAPADYEAATAEVEKLPAKFDLGRLYQVDMIKPAQDAVLGKAVIAELIKAVEILCKLGESGEPAEIKTFREAFLARYEQAMVPLAEALDDEAGVGFGTVMGTDASPLLRGLHLQAGGADPGWNSKQLDSHAMLLQKAYECARTGKTELELDVSSLRLEATHTPLLANAFCLMCTLAAASPDAVQQGDFEIYIHGGAGPSGVTLLGRFCHMDPEIRSQVQNHIRQDEAHDPDAIFAEIVYLPEGRIGNVLCRPVLRDYEIPYLGRSGAQPEKQLPVSDLLVAVEGGSIVLYSRQLGRRVISRMTTAHSFMDPQLSPVYRFLCCLQHQHGAALPGFSWGPAQSLDFLPRVRVGRLVLSLAQWKLSKEEVAALGKAERSRRFLAVQELRRRRALPRWVVLQEGDNSLWVDLENALSVDAFVHVLKRGTQAILTEMYPPFDRLCVSSPEGCFLHELNVPFVQIPHPQTADDAGSGPQRQRGAALASAGVSRDARILPAGSEWLYFKLYGGAAILDDILTITVPPLVRDACASGAADRWFFIRYSDPHEHLRIRFNGVPARLTQELLPLVFQAFNPLLSAGKLWKIELDTYQREVERYGGVEGVLAAEEIFCADSEAVLDILRELRGDEGLDIRWRTGLMGIDRLLSDCGLDEKDRRVTAQRWRDTLQREFKTDATTKQQLSDRFRVERHKLEALLDPAPGPDGPWSFARRAFESRSARIAEPMQRLRAAAAHGKLMANLPDLALSYAHMHINRLIRSTQRAHEFVLYDFLVQLYDSRIARKARSESHSVPSLD
ncbi:MAG TPA: lantibiotic dehydratase [Candidatus Angelobacter sp.]|nr:lantibiotic dehydratase [Candidatus Angelobacter sp.]